MSKVDDNFFPKVIYDMNTSDPTAPTGREWKLYAKAGGIYARSSNSITGPFQTSAGLSNPMSAVGDIIQGTTAGAPAALAAPLAGKVLTGAGLTTPLAYAYPPGYEFDYAQTTSVATISATTAATANTVVTGNAVTYDGSTVVMVEVFFSQIYGPATANIDITVELYDGSSSIGALGSLRSETTNRNVSALFMSRRLTPSNAAHTYSARAWVGTGSGGAGGLAGGSGGTMMPGFIRITKV